MEKSKLTTKQKEIYEYIKSHIVDKGFPPSVRDIAAAVHLKSTSSVHTHLGNLEDKGYIRRDPTKPRAIEILDDDFMSARREMVNVPIVGTVTAGLPILAVENIEDYFSVPKAWLNEKDAFLLKVRGESMINAGIFDGDMVLVEKRDIVNNGEITVAMIEDSATVKTFYKENGMIRLQPENDTMDPIIVSDVTILGKVIGLYRIF